MDAQITVINANRADVERVRSLRLAALADSPLDFASDGDETTWNASAWGDWLTIARAVWLAARDEQDVGLAALEDAWDEADACYVASVWVTPTARGIGVADALLEALIADASRRAARRLHLDVVATNTRARAFYQRHGFRTVGEARHTPRGTREIAMTRPLP